MLVVARTDTFDLGRLGLHSGEARRLDLSVRIEPFEFGGERYVAESSRTPLTLDVARTAGSGYSLRLRLHVCLDGPCMRCLEASGPRFAVDAREIDQPGGGDELDSPYVEGDDLNLAAWSRDALALELPVQILCREDCAGLCPECGENLNAAERGHSHERAPDPRWAKLGELGLK